MSDMLSRLGDYALERVHGSPLSRIINHLMGGQPGASGLQALIDKLRQGGLSEKVDSWVANGPNRPVQPDELERAIGPQEADKLAADAGMERGGLLAALSQFLPRMVDGLTPQGRVPTREEGVGGEPRSDAGPQGGIEGMLSSLLGRLQGQPGQPGGGLDDLLGGLLNRGGGRPGPDAATGPAADTGETVDIRRAPLDGTAADAAGLGRRG